jgi:hypothetical protein
MGWNGADLVADFSAELSDTSTAFKTKVLRWINDGIREIATSHKWHFLREKGEVVLVAGEDTQTIVLATPTAPDVTLSTGGSLTASTAYTVRVTFFEEVSGVESIAGEESDSVTTTSSDKTIVLNNLPASTSGLVTHRRVYLSKAGAAYKLHTTIDNNTDLSVTISTDTSSDITPPEESSLNTIDGAFFINNNRVLEERSLQDLLFITGGSSATGTPSYWAPINNEEIRVHPVPSTETSATNEELLSSQSMAASFTSDAIYAFGATGLSLQPIWTGSPIGTLKLQVSNDPVTDEDDIDNWSDLPNTEIALSGAGDALYEISTRFRWYRLSYTFTSGTGSLTATYTMNSTPTNVMSFYYFKIPTKVYNTSTSIPEIPSWLFDDLRNYVIWRGYDYRDRAGKESKQINYENGLKRTISKKGKPNKGSGRVRCVTPDSDGFVY